MPNNPKEIDNKYEAAAYIVTKVLNFLKKHWWKLMLILTSILVPLIFLQDLIKELIK